MATEPSTVFISYARDEHAAWVTRLADELERLPEFHVVFDQYDLHGGKDLTHFMDRGLRSDRIVVIVTPDYVRKATERLGGVGYESSVISAELLEDQLADRFVPALRAGENRPNFLKSKVYVDFRNDRTFDLALSELIAALRRIPLARRPDKQAIMESGGRNSDTNTSEELILNARLDLDRPVVIIKCDIDGERTPSGLPAVENVGRRPATNVTIEDIHVAGNHGTGTFEPINILRPGETQQVVFDAPDEGLVFRDRFIQYLDTGLRARPARDWSTVTTRDDVRDFFSPLVIRLNVRYTDAVTRRGYRSEHHLEFTYSRHATAKFEGDAEIV